MNPTRLLLCTQWFDPEPTAKGLTFAKALTDRGFTVEVLTGFPNYPTGRIYDGYRLSLYQRESIDGIVVHRTWLYPSHDRSAVRRMITYLSFALSASLFGAAKAERPDVVYAYHPPASTGWMGAWLASLFRVPLVLDVQDLWPDTVVSSGMIQRSWATRLLAVTCRWGYRQAEHVTVLSRGMGQKLEQIGVTDSRLSVIYNWADESRLGLEAQVDLASTELSVLTSGFSVLFAGQMGDAQGLETILDAAEMTPEITWVMLGSGTERTDLIAKAKLRQLTNVHFPPRVPLVEVGRWLQAADVLLVHLKDDPLFDASIPSKTQAYLLAGRPILMAVRGEAAEMVERARAGLVVAPGDPEAIANAANTLKAMSPDERDQLGKNGSEYYHRELSLTIGVDRFAAVFRKVSGH